MEFDFSKSFGPCYGKAQVINLHLALSLFCNSDHQGHYCWDLVVHFLGSKFLDVIPYSRSWFLFSNLIVVLCECASSPLVNFFHIHMKL